VIYLIQCYVFHCSLGYLAENMDSSNGFAPLFEAQLELLESDIVFIPSLDPDEPDCFVSVVEGLINDIIKMASLIPRISLDYEAANYEV